MIHRATWTPSRYPLSCRIVRIQLQAPQLAGIRVLQIQGIALDVWAVFPWLGLVVQATLAIGSESLCNAGTGQPTHSAQVQFLSAEWAEPVRVGYQLGHPHGLLEAG